MGPVQNGFPVLRGIPFGGCSAPVANVKSRARSIHMSSWVGSSLGITRPPAIAVIQLCYNLTYKMEVIARFSCTAQA